MHDRRGKRVRDLEVSGQRTTLVWSQRRMRCDNCAGRFLEHHHAFEGRLIARLARRLVANCKVMTVRRASRWPEGAPQVLLDLPARCSIGPNDVNRSILTAVAVDDPPAGAGWSALWVPPACGAAATGFLWTMRRLWPGAMGGGDVFFAFSALTVPAAAAGPGAALAAGMAALASASVIGSAVVAIRAFRGRRSQANRRIAFGPHLALGSLAGAIWGQTWWSAYTSLWT